MKNFSNFPEAVIEAIAVMVERKVFAMVLRQSKGWRIVMGGPSGGDVAWINFWRAIQRAILCDADPRKVFFFELDRLVEAKNRSALAAASDIRNFDQAIWRNADSFFVKSQVHDFKEYSKGLDRSEDELDF